MDFDKWLKFTNLNDGDVVIVSSGSGVFHGYNFYFYFYQSTFIRLYELSSYNSKFVNKYALPIEALTIFSKYDISTITDLNQLYPSNFIGLEIDKGLLPEELLEYCNINSYGRLVPIILGYISDKGFYINNCYLHIKACIQSTPTEWDLYI